MYICQKLSCRTNCRVSNRQLSIFINYTRLNWNANDEIFFPKLSDLSLNSVNSANSWNLINHWSINWARFIDPTSHMCLDGTLVGSLTQEVTGSSLFTIMTIIFVTEFSETFRKTPLNTRLILRDFPSYLFIMRDACFKTCVVEHADTNTSGLISNINWAWNSI